MKITRHFSCCASSLAIAAAALAPISAHAQNDTDTASDDTIIVSATRRDESVQDIPISVAAFTGEELFELGIRDFENLATGLAGVSLQEGGPGFRTVYLRGVGTGTIGTASTTGFYYDESYVEPGGLVLGIVEPLFFDVNRVEVLRGPQGTLFGGSSMGGTLRFISNTPVMDEFEGAIGADVSATEKGGVNYETNAILNLPLVEDRLAVRLTGNYRNDNGFIDRDIGTFSGPGGDPIGAVVREDNINDSEFIGFRGILEARPTDELMMRVTGVVQKTTSDALPVIDQVQGESLVQQRGFSFDDFLEDDFHLLNLLITYDFGNFELLSTSSWNQRSVDALEDSDGDAFFSNDSIFVRLPREEEALIQELRLISKLDGPLNFVIGGLYEDYSRARSTDFFNGDPAGASTQFFSIAGETDRRQIAVYGEANYELTDSLTVTAGLRYYDYDIENNNTNANTIGETSETGVNPRFQIEYQASDDALLYASASKGFRPGDARQDLILDADTTVAGCGAALGVNVNADGSLDGFESDSLWTYEGGAKTQWADGRVTANLAGYYTDWSDIQQFASFPDPCQVNFFLANVGGARIFGFEAEFDVQVSDAFSVFGGVGYTNAETTEDVPGSFLVEGSPLQNVPEWTGNVNAQYVMPIGQYEGSALLSYRHVSQSSSTIIPSPNPPVQEGYGIVNFRFGLSNDDMLVSLYVDNLTNELPLRTFFASSLGAPRANERFFTERPRTYGISLRKDF